MGIKRIIFLAFTLMVFGTMIELLLLGHYEDVYQLIPISCIALVIIISAILYFLRTKVLKQIFKIILIITAISGLYGAYLHLSSNFEFEIEMQPTATNLDLIIESFTGALPVLAPFSMVVLALIGYSYLILINQNKP
ncbi:hypothetical protein ACFQ1Q_13420 [Winogradskyella litorisediminis]|uniref:Uncharacterized protein n=1 Tax=Winogradskyella litorisediminis TaxID=1156618 RepID=A0ABW3NCL0_9FLAO